MFVKIGNLRVSFAGIAIFFHVLSLYLLYTPVTSMYTYYLAVLSSVCIFVERGVPRKLDNCTVNYIVFCLFCFFSIVYAVSPITSLKRCVLILLMATNMIAIGQYCFNQHNLEHVEKCIVVAGPILVIYTLFKTGIHISNSFRFGHGVINENTMAFQLMISAFFVYKLSKIHGWNAKGKVFLLIDLIGMFLCSSRAVFASLFVCVVCIVILDISPKMSVQKLLYIISGVICVFAVLVIASNYLKNSAAIQVGIERLLSVFDIVKGSQEDLSVASRGRMISFGLELFRQKPILGYGIDSFKSLYPLKQAYAHNNFVELLVDTGVIGFCIYYSMFFGSLFCQFKNWRETRAVTNIPLVWAILVFGMGSVYYDLATVMYVMILSNKSIDIHSVKRSIASTPLEEQPPEERLSGDYLDFLM